MRLICLTLLGAGLLGAADARELVRGALARDAENWEHARNYTFSERTEERELDDSGRVTSRKTKSYDVLVMYGQPYWLLTLKDDRPLPAGEVRKQNERLGKLQAKLKRMSEQERRKQAREYFAELDKERAFLREIPDAFDFRLTGEETYAGRPAYVVECTPRAGYRAADSRAKYLPRVKAKVWIDKAESQWLRIEADVIDDIPLGFFIAKIHRGSRLEFEQTPVGNGVWLPNRAHLKVAGRIALLKKLNRESIITFSNFRKVTPEGSLAAGGTKNEVD